MSAVLYVITGIVLALTPLAWDPAAEPRYPLRVAAIAFLAILALGLAVLAWLTIRGLRRRRRWAFNTALVLFVLYLPSLFLPLGAVGLFGLLSAGTRAAFPRRPPQRADRR